MPTSLRGGANRAAKTFAAFTPGQKAVSILAVVALVVGALAFTRWAARPTYATLYSGLAPADASAIVDELNGAGTPYELPNATTILVPKDAVYDTRLALAGKSLPAGDTSGYSILDKQGITTSEFQQQIGLQRAMEGELKETIESIEGVQAARVQLAVPKQDVFADEDGKPTASVLVTTLPGRDLSPQQVQAIVHLVDQGVPELEPDQVTVADATGKLLNASSESGPGAVGDMRSQQVQAYEKRVTDDVQAMLEKVVGAGNVAVKVTADLDYDQTETREKKHDYNKGVPPISQKKTTEEYKGGSTPVGGVLGPDSIGVPPPGNGTGDYRKSDETNNNAVDSTESVRRAAPGGVRRLHTAVLLNARAAGTLDPQQVQDMVAAGIGIDETRGDTINVSRMAFDESAAEAAKKALEAEQAKERKAALMAGLRTGGLVLLVLLLLVAALIARKRRGASVEARYQIELEALQRQMAELEERSPRALEAGAQPIAELEAGPADPEAERMAAVRDEIGDLVDGQPDEVAQLLRGWLADRRG